MVPNHQPASPWFWCILQTRTGLLPIWKQQVLNRELVSKPKQNPRRLQQIHSHRFYYNWVSNIIKLISFLDPDPFNVFHCSMRSMLQHQHTEHTSSKKIQEKIICHEKLVDQLLQQPLGQQQLVNALPRTSLYSDPAITDHANLLAKGGTGPGKTTRYGRQRRTIRHVVIRWMGQRQITSWKRWSTMV